MYDVLGPSRVRGIRTLPSFSRRRRLPAYRRWLKPAAVALKAKRLLCGGARLLRYWRSAATLDGAVRQAKCRLPAGRRPSANAPCAATALPWTGDLALPAAPSGGRTWRRRRPGGRNKATRQLLPPLRLRTADGNRLPVPSACCAAVTASNGRMPSACRCSGSNILPYVWRHGGGIVKEGLSLKRILHQVYVSERLT